MKPSFKRVSRYPLMRFALIVLLLCSLVPLTHPDIARAATDRYVATNGSDIGDCSTSSAPCQTITYAIAQSTAGDTIRLSAGTYVERITIDRSIQIVGIARDTTIIDGAALGTVVTVSPAVSVTLTSMTIRNGRTTGAGGGIKNDGSLTVINSMISDNIINDNTAIVYGAGVFNGFSATLVLDSTTITHNTLANPNASWGAGLFNGSSATISNSSIISNTISSGTDAYGGGIFNYYNATLNVNDTSVNGNTIAGSVNAQGAGVTAFSGGDVRLLRSHVNGNQARGGNTSGAGMEVEGGTLVVTDSSISNNQALGTIGQGGGIECRGVLTLTNSTISGNQAAYAGGIASGDATLTNVIITNNRSETGAGGMFIALNATVTAGRTTIQNNRTGGYGGGIESNGRLIIFNSKIIGNVTPSAGGGIDNNGVLTVTDSLISANRLENPIGDGLWEGRKSPNDPPNPQAREFGGGIWSRTGSKLFLTRTTISGHQVGGDPGHSFGGGLNISADVAVLTDVVVSGNEALGGGGGIAVGGGNTSLTINGSTISGNNTKDAGPAGCPLRNCNEGGGILITGANISAIIANSTISGNHSDNIAGGIFWQSGVNGFPDVVLDHVTVTGNTATQGGGIWRNGPEPSVRVRNSIIAGNKSLDTTYLAASDCEGDLNSEGKNLFGIVGECGPISTDLVGSEATPLDPLLGPLQNNGGSTPTHALLAGSPAKDADGACALLDQRGIARNQVGGPACDIGAYESSSATKLVFTREPSTPVVAQQPFAQSFEVTARDEQGNVASLAGNVTLSVAFDPCTEVLSVRNTCSRATLTGTITQPLVGGVATFTNIALTQAGTGFRLLASAAGVSSATGSALTVLTSTPFVQPDPNINPDPYESNNVITNAFPIVFDTHGTADYAATISTTSDVDVFTFGARPSSLITVTLDRLPADYDLVLLRDPRDVTADITDTLDLSNLISLQRATNPRGMVPRGMVPRGMVPRGMVPDDTSLDSLVVDASANPGTEAEQLALSLPLGGTYYIAVLSTRNQADASKQYHLHIALQPGDLQLPTITAQRVSGLNLSPSAEVRTIYLTDFARMRARYPAPDQQSAAGDIQALLSSNSLLIQQSQGVVLDVPTVLTQLADFDRLNALYNQWDAGADQPLLANEVANQIQRILLEAFRNYYPNVTDLVLVGGDEVLPFARVPDENAYGNEQEYFAALQHDANTLNASSPFAASLRRGFMQTDDFYARRRSIAYRGRQLNLPDMGVGRLVELPSDIVRYLRAYDSPVSFTVQANQDNGHQPRAFVTGYDFVKDQAQEVTGELNKLGVSTTNSTLIGDTWTTPEFEQEWFSGQLPQLTSIYTPTASGPTTQYDIVSLNGHFSHYAAEPAASTANPDLEAQRILTPTIAFGQEARAFFKRDQNGQQSATLLYSIGCHAGLSAPINAFSGSQEDFYAADFASAVVKQGGNWIGNTGYGYADTVTVGYSERLAVLFTEELGHDEETSGTYTGVGIGQALMRAKQRYVSERGIGGFSVADEKVITGWTLYGLPFIKVRVQNRSHMQPVPPAIAPTLENGVFKRTITLTANSLPDSRSADGSIPQIQVTMLDSLAPDVTRAISGVPQGNWGAPVLPVLSIPLAVPLEAGRTTQELPQLRGVRLLEASAAPDEHGYIPRITSPITDTTITGAAPGRELSLRGLWTPDLIFGAVRAPFNQSDTVSQLRDVVLVHPVQFKATTKRSGNLRRFTRLVLELTYVDPRTAAPSLLADHQGPMVDALTVQGPITSSGVHDVTFQIQVSEATLLVQQDAVAPSGILTVDVVYTGDGSTWQHTPASLQPGAPGTYQATVPVALSGQGLFAYIEVGDAAGNVTTRVLDQGVMHLQLPIISRR